MVDAQLARFNLKEHQHKRVRMLSGGTARKLSAAISLTCDPEVVFLDEPTTGVDVSYPRSGSNLGVASRC